MKNAYLKLASLGLAMLATGCGGGGSDSNVGTSVPTAAVKITPANGTTVARETILSSKDLARSSSGLASTVGVVAQPSTSTRSVLDMSLARFAQIRSRVQLDPANGVVGVVAGFPITLGCAKSGTWTLNVQDSNNNTVVDSGDVLTMSLLNCNDGASTDNGSLAFSITTINGNFGGAGTPSAPLIATFTLSFNNFSSRDNVTGLTDLVNGNISFSTSDDGINTTGTMSSTSLSMSNGAGDAFLITNYAISFTEANVPTATTPYSFTFNMTLASTNMNGSVIIATTTPFTGQGTGEPTAGEMVITGANNSTLTLTAHGDGVNIGIVVDEDGAAGPIAPVALADLAWAAI